MYTKLVKLFIQAKRGDLLSTKRTAKIVGYSFAALGIMIFMVAYAIGMIFAFKNLNVTQSADLLGTGFIAITIINVIFGLRVAYGLFGLSRDLPFLLSLPISPSTIFAAKLTMGYLSEFLMTVLFTLPLLVGYQVAQGTVLTAFASLFVLLAMPALSLCISSLITMLLVRVLSFLHIGDGFFVALNSLVGIAFAILIQVFSRNMQESMQVDAANPMAAMSGLFAFSNVFPPLKWAGEGIVHPFQAKFWLFILFMGLIVTVICLLGGRMYKNGEQIIAESKKKTKSKKGYKKSGAIRAIMQKDLRVIIRTPVYAVNLFGLLICGPLIMLIMSFSMSTPDVDVMSMISSNGTVWFFITFGFIAFMSSINTVASTAMSREGRATWIDLTMPVTPLNQIIGKLGLGLIVGIIESILIVLIVMIRFKAPTKMVLLGGVCGIIATIAPQIVSSLPDISKPKLNWSSEQEAMKNNLSTLFGMLLALLLLLPQVVVCIIFRQSLTTIVISSLVLSIVECVIIAVALPSTAKKAFENWREIYA